MLTPWATEIDITRELVTGSLEADFPDLHIHNLASLGEDLASVCAMIGWGAAHFGDPAIDFAGFYYWRGAPFVDQVFRHYPGVLDSEILNRAALRPLPPPHSPTSAMMRPPLF